MATPARLISARQIWRVHLKSQALVNLFFGIPMVTLVLPFWGLPLLATFKVTAIYLAVYFLVYYPLWLILPWHLLRPHRQTIDAIERGEMPDDLKLKKLIEFLLDYPLTSSIRQYILIQIGFLLGAILVTTGAVNELMSIVSLAVIYVLVVGLVVSIIEAFLNFTFLQTTLALPVASILKLRPVLTNEQFEVRRVPLLRKILFVILGTVISIQLIVFIFMVGKLAIDLPESVVPTILYLGLFMALTAVYTVIAAWIFTRNIASPLRQLIDWSKEVSAGDRSSLNVATNDEINDVVLYTNHMVSTLGQLTSWLEKERDQLASEKNKLAVVLSKVDDGVVATDANGDILVFNKAMEMLTGLNESEVVGSSVSQVLNLNHENGQDYDLAKDIQAATAQQISQSQRLSLRLINNQNQDKFVTLSTSALAHPTLDQVGCILTFHDVTEERELERMKVDFVSMAAHELRTPLTSIRGYLDVLSKEAKSKLSEDQVSFLQRSLVGVDQLSTLIESLLNVSRIENNELTVSLAPISMAKLVNYTVEGLSEMAEHNKLAISVTSPSKDHLVQGDSLRLTEVLTNLLANAINYSRPGSSIKVSIELDQDKRRTTVRVADQGPGIPPEAIKQLFQKFYRVSNNGTGPKGTGLGLYISKSIVDAHNGSIWVESTVGTGSVFSFSLPWAEEGAIEKEFTPAALIAPKQSSSTSTNQLVSS